jgi:hypothetical protein
MITHKKLIPGSVMTGAVVTYYTAPNQSVQSQAIVQRMVLCNTTAGAVSCTVHVIPSGGAAGAATTILSAKSIAAGASYVVTEIEGMVLEVGSFIQALGTGVTIQASGNEIT